MQHYLSAPYKNRPDLSNTTQNDCQRHWLYPVNPFIQTVCGAYNALIVYEPHNIKTYFPHGIYTCASLHIDLHICKPSYRFIYSNANLHIYIYVYTYTSHQTYLHICKPTYRFTYVQTYI